MTRINLIDPRELTDQHLIAEYRELPRIFWAVRGKLIENKEIKIWNKYKMWTWHVIFFYDKLWFLEKRYYLIVNECKKRWFNIKFDTLDLSDIPSNFKNNYTPTKEDIEISSWRIQEKLDQKKWFYKMNWIIIN
jgi:deoxyribonuclease (pyrimidine dimer)